MSLSPIVDGVRAGSGYIQWAAVVVPASLSWGGWLRTCSQGHHSNWLALTGGAVVMVGWWRTPDRERDSILYESHMIYSVWLIFFQVLFVSWSLLPFSSLSRCLTRTHSLHLFNWCRKTHTHLRQYSLSLSAPIFLSVPFGVRVSLHTMTRVLVGLQC